MSPQPAHSRPHPLVLVAAASVTALSLAGVIAIGSSQGWFGGNAPPAATAAVAPAGSLPVGTVTPTPISVQQTVNVPSAKAEAPAATKVGTGATAPRPPARPAVPAASPAPTVSYTPPPVAAPAPMPVVCRDCGTVDAINEIEAEGKAGPAGAIIGGVVGAVVGNQIGHGTGRDVARVLGAAGGAYAGHQIEKSNSKAVRFETVVRFEDGSTQRIVSEMRPSWRAGDPVRLINGELVPRR